MSSVQKLKQYFLELHREIIFKTFPKNINTSLLVIIIPYTVAAYLIELTQKYSDFRSFSVNTRAGLATLRQRDNY